VPESARVERVATELVDVPSVRLLWLLLPLMSVMAALLVETEVKVEADGSAE
jgi:hypothetical protein